MIIGSVNESMLEMLGRDASITGHPFMESVPELMETQLMDRLRHVLTTGETYRQPEEKLSILRYGQPHTGYYTYIFKPLRNTLGEIYGIMCTCTEVTEQVMARKKIEEADAQIRNTAERLQVALEAGRLGSYVLTLATGEIFCTLQYKKNFGVPEDYEMTYEKLQTIIHPDDRAWVQALLKNAVANNSPYNAEYRIHLPDRRIRWIKASGKVILNDAGEAEKVIGVTIDNTEEKNFASELTKQVRERTIELQRSNEDLLRFAHVASHDLKEPVRKIKTFANRLQTDASELLPPKSLGYLEKIQSATDRMYNMIEGVLAYSELNKPDQVIESIDLNAVLAHIEADLEVVIAHKNATINKTVLCTIEGASVLIYQLLYNIVNNCLKFSRQEVPPVINITCEQTMQDDIAMARIIIADNGIGFDNSNAEKIFGTFARLHSKDEFEGTGLGLALCRRIVSRHHGSIVASSPGEGAVFTILLPLKQAHFV